MFGCILLAIAYMLIAENSFKYICLLITKKKKKKTNKRTKRERKTEDFKKMYINRQAKKGKEKKGYSSVDTYV